MRYQGRCHIGERKKSGGFIDSWLLGRQSRLLDQKEMYRKTSTHLEPPTSSSNRHRHLSDSTRRRSGTVDTPVTIPEEGRIRRVSEGDERERHDSGSSTRSACSSKSADDHLDHLDSGKSSTCSVLSELVAV